MEINNGGFAFPCEEDTDYLVTKYQGMTIRDYFAAKALSVAWGAYDKGYTGEQECVEQSIAYHAYQIADEMLKARCK